MGLRDRNPLKLNKASLSKMGKNNHMWKGDNVGYTQLHNWIFIRLKNKNICNICKKEKKCDLANKGIYNRDLKNWEWLCRSCHMIKDGRMDKLRLSQVKLNAKQLLEIKKLFIKIK